MKPRELVGHRSSAVLLVLLACLATLVTAAPVLGPRTAAATSPPTLSVLVLGDSYSSGFGAGSYYSTSSADKTCDLSRKNYGNEYARLVRDKLRYRVTVSTRACSGAGTGDYFHAKGTRPAQRTWVTKGYDVVLLTLGGIDLGFKAVVRQCLSPATDNPRRCAEVLSRSQRFLRSRVLDERLQRVLTDIRTRANPTTRVVLLGYPRLEIDTSLRFGAIRLGQQLKAISDLGDEQQARAVAAVNAQDPAKRTAFVSTQALFSGSLAWLPASDRGRRHELHKGRVNPARWLIQPLQHEPAGDKDISYHPTPRGWHQIAELLYRTGSVPGAPVGSPQTSPTRTAHRH